MLDRRWSLMRPSAVAVLLAVVIAGCASAPTVTPNATSDPTVAASPTPTPTPAPIVGVARVPTACLNVGPLDCERVGDMAMALVDAAGVIVVYLQVGPFGCANGEADCPVSLDARPEGDVVVEIQGASAVGLHVKVEAGVPSLERTETFGVVLDPGSRPPIALGPQPFDLGHCGFYSGIDVGGSWWDPVGPIDADHNDAINSASGILTINDPDHAVFVSSGGLTLQLLRRDGPKHLPMCQ